MCTILPFNGPQVLIQEKGHKFTIEFLSLMIHHHHHGVEMSEKILQKTYNEAIIHEAKGIIETQVKEAEKMKRWLRRWYHQGPSKLAKRIAESNMCEEMSMHPMDPNDKQFVDMMIHSHKEGNVMSLLAIQKSNKKRVRKLAEKMFEDRTAQIKRLSRIDRSLQSQENVHH